MNVRLATLDPLRYSDTLLGLVFHVWLKIFACTRLWGSPSLLFTGYGGHISRRVQRQGREADHLHLVPR
jgi:hypothetical protein